MQRFVREDQPWCLAQAGIMAAILGERTSAQRAVDACQGNSDFTRLQAGKIAAMLGDINAAEAIIREAYKTRGCNWDWGNSEIVGDILTIVAKQDVTAAEKLWEMVEKLLTLPLSMWVICRPQGTRRLEGYVANASGIASG